jgi:hypothetical protein
MNIMKKIVFLIIALLVTLIVKGQTPNFNWVKNFGTNASNDIGKSQVIDDQGNIYITGAFQGVIDVDSGPGTYTLSSAGNSDIFVMKLDSLANVIWAKRIGSTFYDIGHSIIFDSAGNLIITGEFQATVDFDPNVGQYNLTATVGGNFQDIFLLKLDVNGNFIWANRFGGSLNDIPKSICEDSNGNFIVGGMSRLGGINTSVLLKYSSTGTLIWSKYFNSNLDDGEIRSLDIDSNGNIYSCGYFSGTTDFDPGIGTYTLSAVSSSLSARDGYICKLDANGQFKWVTAITGSLTAMSNNIKVDKKNNLYVTGSIEGTNVFGTNTPSLTLVSVGFLDAFLAKLDTLGNFVWLKQYGSSNSEEGKLVEIDSIGNVYASGKFGNVIDFDLGVGVSNLNYLQGSNYFLKLDTLGAFIWANQYGGIAYDLKCDKKMNIFSIGNFNTVADFDPTTGVYNLSPQTGSIFIHRMGNCMSPVAPLNGTGINNLSICPNSATTLIASGIGSLSWFSTSTSTTSLVSQNTFTTPLLSTGVYTYYVASRICATNSTLTPISFTVNSIPTLTINTSSIAICAGANATMSVLGANTYTWSSWFSSLITSNDTLVFTPSSNTTFTVIGKDFNGCINTNTITLFYNQLPMFNFALDYSHCVGTSSTFTLSSSSAAIPTPNYTYTCYPGGIVSTPLASTVVASTISLFPINSTNVYTVTAQDTLGCTYTRTVVIYADIACQDVWPGDANSDGVADNLDVLELGLHYTQTGAPRVIASNTWQSYFANNWAGTITSGKNLNHSDCNGDGIINDNDTLAIYNNYGLLHTFKPAQTNTVNPQLSIVPDQPTVVKGMWGTASVYLGDATSPINNINGIAYTVDFDNTLIDLNSIWIEYQNSFVDAGQNLYFSKLDFANGKIFTASTHTVSNNVSGFGKIATLHYKILSNLATDEVLNIGLRQANHSNATGLITPLTSGTGTLMAIGASVGVKENLYNGNVLVSPNPTNGILNISFSTIPQNTKIELYNSIGALVLAETMTIKNNTISVSDLSSGIYFLKVLEGNKVVAVKKVVKE